VRKIKEILRLKAQWHVRCRYLHQHWGGADDGV
jgi:hypothetical protein